MYEETEEQKVCHSPKSVLLNSTLLDPMTGLKIKDRTARVIFPVFHHSDKIPEKSNLREKGFILAHGFKGFSSSWQGGCGSAEAPIVAARKQGGREVLY
jgi:hypothetical protein